MRLGFVTGSDNKVEEFRRVLGDEIELVKLQADLPELQSLDPKKIIRPKLDVAVNKFPDIDAIVVEDTSFCVDVLKGLPGTMVKHFLNAPKNYNEGETGIKEGPQLIYQMARGVEPDGELRAYAQVHIGYRSQTDEVEFFEGRIDGHLVDAGDNGWGFDRILIPDGYKQRLGDLGPTIKAEISHRAMAVKSLKAFLQKQVQV